MCGIAGAFSIKGDRDLPQTVERMCRAIAHRGPDGHGVWTDLDAGVALGHRRLSIIDLSVEGDQPMVSADGRFVIVFNGEIYNYLAVKAELDASGRAPAWRGHSDTEVLIEAVSILGVETALQQIEGQFAFALWDRAKRTLYLARDRFGEKPLYYGWAGADLVFASELKALRRHPDFDDELDPEAVAGYFRYGYVPTPLSIYRKIQKLEAGGFISIDQRDFSARRPTVKSFWRLADVVEPAISHPFAGSEDEAVEILDSMMRRTVKSRMTSDVPLGALLSGGIDSSSIVACMQTQSSRPIKTFTIGTWDKALNEAEYARETARILGTDHTELYVGGQEALDVVPKLPHIYDEPFADSSQIPTFLVSALARRSVTVALSGDGGDEIFGGYNRHFFGSVWGALDRLPYAGRRAAAATVHAVPTNVWSALFRGAGPLSPSVLRHGRGGDKLHKFADKLRARSEKDFQRQLLSVCEAPEAILLSQAPGMDITGERLPPFELGGFAQRSMYLDTINYLPDDIMVKVDRASMASSLEVRAPFLDTQVLGFAWSLPMSMKIQGRSGKRILKRVLERYVPRNLFDRPKAGFAVPVAEWLRNELKPWGESLLTHSRLSEADIFDVAAVRSIWEEHQSGRRNWDARLWTILMFQAWREGQDKLSFGDAGLDPPSRMVAKTAASSTH